MSNATVQTATAAMDSAKLSRLHWKVWFLSAMGICLDGFDLFIIAIALPFIMLSFPHLSPSMTGMILAASPIGCIFGATIFGRFTDKLGRKTVLLIDLLFFVVFAGMSAIAWDAESLIFFRFLLGIGIGADYPVSSTYITENMPKKLRGKMLVSGFGFQALGALAGAGLGTLIVAFYPSPDAWRYMLGFAMVPAVIILLFRLTLPESPRWLIHNGKIEQAEEIAAKMTGKKLKVAALEAAETSSFLNLFSPRYIKRTFLTAMSWFIMDIGLYGIGLFAPILLAKLAITHAGVTHLEKFTDAIHKSLFTDLFLIIGIIFAVFLVEKWGRIKLQAIGFFGMACGLFLIAATAIFPENSPYYSIVGLVGFCLFYMMVNIGPNPITYLLPAEVFPTHLRATGHGFAAASGKVGAALGALIIPVLMHNSNLQTTMVVIGLACLVGFIITSALGYETKGKSLDELHQVEKTMDSAEIGLLTVQQDIVKLNHDLKRVESALASAIKEIRKMRDPNHQKFK